MGVFYVSSIISLLLFWISGTLQTCLSKDNTCLYWKEMLKMECRGAINHIEHRLKVKIFHACDLKNTTIHLEDLNDLVNLEELAITHSAVKKIQGSFPELNFIKVLNLSNLLLEHISDQLLAPLKYLETLDLSHNQLKYLHLHIVFDLKSVKTVFLAGNAWNCSLDLNWVTYLENSTTLDLSDLKCRGKLYYDKPLPAIAFYIKSMHANCVANCTCEMLNVVRHHNSEQLEPIIQMNCSDRGLLELPHEFPEYTRILLLQRNDITDLLPLINNPKYLDIWDLYVDQNSISSVAILEDSFWLSHFRLLSLRENRLNQLPIYALDNALQLNLNTPALQLLLGGNPWRCDCLFTPGFQEFLHKYYRQIKDINDIKCSFVEDDENSLKPIIKISRSNVCRSPADYSIPALDLLNCILAGLIVFIVGKLAYDYLIFKRTGRLPWIVTKIP